jgi:hypothetical protein
VGSFFQTKISIAHAGGKGKKMSRTVKADKPIGWETWKRISKAAGCWYYSNKKLIKQKTNRFLRRKEKINADNQNNPA